MKKSLFHLFFTVMMICAVFSFFSCKDSARAKEVIVYTYDSFSGEWGPGNELAAKFEAKTGYKLTFVGLDNAISALNRAKLEKNNVQADVILGIDNNIAEDAKKSGILAKYQPKDLNKIVSEALLNELDTEGFITPYDYSHFAMIYDTQSDIPAPSSIEDLAKDIYKKKIILMDPRTSTPGLGFLSWTVALFGDDKDAFEQFWSKMGENILAMTPEWSSGWGMFLNNEAPLVISYTTSPAYNVEYENDERYVALVFDEGHVQQVEGYALLKNAPNASGAKAFMDFMITKEAQECLPLTQWMYPVNTEVELPESYKKAAPIPSVTLKTDVQKNAECLEKVMEILEK